MSLKTRTQPAGQLDHGKPAYKEAAKTLQGEKVGPAGGSANTLDLRLALSREEWPLGRDVEHIQPAEALDRNESWTGQVAINTIVENVVRNPGV